MLNAARTQSAPPQTKKQTIISCTCLGAWLGACVGLVTGEILCNTVYSYNENKVILQATTDYINQQGLPAGCDRLTVTPEIFCNSTSSFNEMNALDDAADPYAQSVLAQRKNQFWLSWGCPVAIGCVAGAFIGFGYGLYKAAQGEPTENPVNIEISQHRNALFSPQRASSPQEQDEEVQSSRLHTAAASNV